jgi:hypothetical protein
VRLSARTLIERRGLWLGFFWTVTPGGYYRTEQVDVHVCLLPPVVLQVTWKRI